MREDPDVCFPLNATSDAASEQGDTEEAWKLSSDSSSG